MTRLLVYPFNVAGTAPAALTGGPMIRHATAALMRTQSDESRAQGRDAKDRPTIPYRALDRECLGW
jgi:hypothetical protein